MSPRSLVLLQVDDRGEAETVATLEQDCPSLIELMTYAHRQHPTAASRADIESHLRACPTCRLTARNLAAEQDSPASRSPDSGRAQLSSASQQAVQRFRHTLAQTQPDEIRFGQIWTTRPSIGEEETRAEASTRMIVILLSHPGGIVDDLRAVLAAPISLDVRYAAQFDFTLTESDSSLGYPFMIETWNALYVLRDQLDWFVGRFVQPFRRYIGMVYQASIGLEVDLSAVGPHVGPPVIEMGDPRTAFQEYEGETVEYLRRPYLDRLTRSETQVALQPKVIAFRGLKVRREPIPRHAQVSGLTAPLAAANEGALAPAYQMSATHEGQDILAVVERDYGSAALYLEWLLVPEMLRERRLLTRIQLRDGETVTAESASIAPGGRVYFGHGRRLKPGDVLQLDVEFGSEE
jgi:hypothetical protein